MAITKEKQISKIEVVGEYKVVQVRTDIILIEDGTELSRSYHRHVLVPDANITNEHADVQSICNTVWTQEVKDAWNTFKQEQENNGV